MTDPMREALEVLSQIDGSPVNVASAEILAARVRYFAREALTASAPGEPQPVAWGELADSIAAAEAMLSAHMEEFHDFEYEPHNVPIEIASLLRIQHHLSGSLIDKNGAALHREASASSGVAERPVVSIKPMALSDGRTDYFVSIRVGDREVTPHVFREEYKSDYHVALYDWLLNGTGEEPDLMEFGPDDWPAKVLTPSRPDAGGGVRVKLLQWEQPDGPDGTSWVGHGTDMCQHYIRFDSETASYWMPGERPLSDDDDSAEEFFALDDAKAAAQADYERRIRSALAGNVSAEARLRDALERIVRIDRGYVRPSDSLDPDRIIEDGRGKGHNTLYLWESGYIAKKALSAGGDEAKKSEGGDESRVAAVSCEIPTQRSGESRDPLGDGSVNTSPHREDAAGVAPGPSDPTADRREIDPKVHLLLQIVARAKGEIDTTEYDHSFINFFCDDRGRGTDTYNLAIDAGHLRSSFNDLFETSRAYLTDAGRAILAALGGR